MDLPYDARPGQRTMMDAIAGVQRRGGHLVLEAGTGTGKTIAALVASLQSRGQDQRRILYTTRTNSQQAQLMREHAALRRSGQGPGTLVPFMGRRHFCPLLRDDPEFASADAEELAKACSKAKQKARVAAETGKEQQGACPYFQKLLEEGDGPVDEALGACHDSPSALAHDLQQRGLCPYEGLKSRIRDAAVLAVPYIYLIDDRLRRALQDWLGCGLDDVHLIVDEAHNLPEAAREHHSPRLSAITLARARKEAERYQDPVLAGEITATAFLDTLRRIIAGLATDHIRNGEDALLPPDAVTEALMGGLQMSSVGIRRIAAELDQWGQIIRDDKASQGRLARSYLGAVGAFLRFWTDSHDLPYAHLVTGGRNPALEAMLLDPASILTWLWDCWSTTHMSGTLAPLDEHVHRSGLPGSCERVRIPSPYRADQLSIHALQGMRRSWQAAQEDPSIIARHQQAAVETLAHLRGRTALFFPSHQMLQDYLEEGFLHGQPRRRFIEEPGMPQAALTNLLERFCRSRDPDALLLAVLGGRTTEGIDFPGDALQNIIIMGIPYPRPTARSEALLQHYEARHGRGWEYAVHNPTGRVLRQALGRLVRGPTDKGTVMILDDRAVRFWGFLDDLRLVTDPQEMGRLPTVGGDFRPALATTVATEGGFPTQKERNG